MNRRVHTMLLRPDPRRNPDEWQRVKVVKVEDLRLPIHVALGRLEAATEEELNDIIADARHELARRV